jgi:glycosyltransferase involved in cell wall biosynthesis
LSGELIPESLVSLMKIPENGQPLVSVIIPNYNHTRFIPYAIRSVLAQGYPHYEIIVVDDGSTDDSREVVARFGDKVHYIWQENQGLAGARNTGIRAARGELIGLLDADDEWHPNYLEEMVALSGEYPEAAVFYCMAQCMDVNGRGLPQFVGGPAVDPKLLYQVLLRSNFIIPSTVMFRRKAILDSGCFDAGLRSCEDWDLWLRLLSKGTIVGASKSLARYRVHESSLSINVEGMHTATKKVVEKHFGGEEGDPSSWKPEKRRAYGGVYRYQCITFVQRQNNWEACRPLMRKALQTDPSLALDLDFFYELALGAQPVGYRGVAELQGFDANAVQLLKLVHESVDALEDRSTRKRALATTCHALGLVSYDLGTRSLFRKYFGRALAYRPELILNAGLVAKYFKSFVSKNRMEYLKKLMKPPL